MEAQTRKFNNMLSLIPNQHNSSDYYKILQGQYKSKVKVGRKEDELSLVDKFIVNEIFLDLAEVMENHILKLDVSSIKRSTLKHKKKICRRHDYAYSVNNTKLMRDNYGGISHLGIDEDTFFKSLEKYGRSMKLY